MVMDAECYPHDLEPLKALDCLRGARCSTEVVSMNQWSLYDRPEAVIPFVMGGYGGQAAVYYGANDDPARAGFDALAGWGFDIELCRG
jgi:hypothetical protein